MFIILIHYTQPLEVIDQHLAAHRAFLKDCYEKNYFVASGPQVPRTGGVIISHLADKEQLETIIANDPFNIHDVADYNIIEFTPVLFAEPFAAFVK